MLITYCRDLRPEKALLNLNYEILTDGWTTNTDDDVYLIPIPAQPQNGIV
jgi:hypothetical protein